MRAQIVDPAETVVSREHGSNQPRRLGPRWRFCHLNDCHAIDGIRRLAREPSDGYDFAREL
jgi:hypothetical protein